jgi:PAS domain S-box-containing protein
MRSIRTRKKCVGLADASKLLIGCISDITDLKDREASVRLLFEGNPIPMWVYEHASLKFLAVNNAAIRHYGYSREQFLSMTIPDVRPVDDREKIRTTIQVPGEEYQGGLIWRHVKRDGGKIEALEYGQALDYQGSSASLVAAIDVTEQRRAEAELSETRLFLNTLIEGVPAIIVVADAGDFRYVHINRAAETFFGLSRKEMIGKTTHDIFADRLPTSSSVTISFRCKAIRLPYSTNTKFQPRGMEFV